MCVAAGITWIGWLGYKSLHALADGFGWDDGSSIVWLILIVSIGGPMLIAWVVAGFQKSAASRRGAPPPATTNTLENFLAAATLCTLLDQAVSPDPSLSLWLLGRLDFTLILRK